MSKPRKKKGKKPLGALEALGELKGNCKLVIKDLQDLKKTFSDVEKRHTEPPNLEASFTYADTPVPNDIPLHIRQCFLDAEIAFLEVLCTQEEASKQLLNVRSAFVAWYSASLEVWYVKFHRNPPF